MQLLKEKELPVYFLYRLSLTGKVRKFLAVRPYAVAPIIF